MPRLKGSVFIEAPVARVEQLGVDVARWPEWVPGLDHVSTSPDFPAQGATARLALGARGFTLNLTLKVIERQPGQRAVFALEGMIKGSNTWTFEPQEGGTLTRCVMEYSVPGGPVGERVYRSMVQPILVTLLERILNSLAEEAESAA